jgi:RNA recognition motif-containing protein
MGNFVYVGNLAPTTTEDALRKAFGTGRTVKSVVVMQSPQTGRSRGFGFVEVGSEDEVASTIQAMNGFALDGRKLKVDRARERVMHTRSDSRSFNS